MKKSTVLTHHEINDLIRKYNSELRKLEYQVDRIQEALSDLTQMQEEYTSQEQNGASSSVSSAAVSSRNGSSAKKQTEAPQPVAEEKTESKPQSRGGRKPKAKSDTTGKTKTVKTKKPGRSGGYRLSVWDKFILNALTEKGKTLINSELYEQAKDYAAEHNIDIPNEKLRGKLSRSIHKLANKRKELVKVPYEGKGFAYALIDWVTAEGKLKQKYSR